MSKIFFRATVGAAVGIAFATPAPACSPLFGDALRKVSSAIVWGEVVVRNDGTATIKVSRREKGPRLRMIQVRWDPKFVSDGVNCPEWQPLKERERGRFFLGSNGDGTYSIVRHDHRPGIDS